MPWRDSPTEFPDDTGGGRATNLGYRRIARFFLFVIGAFLLALGLRSFVIAPFSIPSESMEPSLLVGDYIIATKWDYGLGRGERRIGARLPERGDIVIFDAGFPRRHYVKRVIGLPGDRIAMDDGHLILNGTPLPRRRLPDFMLTITRQMEEAVRQSALVSACLDPRFERVSADGKRQCRFRRFAVTLPGGRSHRILDLADGLSGDDMAEVVVPEDRLFVMGDNRDRSLDSRLPDGEPGAIGLVPAADVVGRAAFVIFSVDGSAQIGKPQGWPKAVRWSRIGTGLR